MLKITRFSIQNPKLKPWVKFIWYLETESEVTINHKLLPTDSIDIIFNRSDQIEYQIGSQIFSPNRVMDLKSVSEELYEEFQAVFLREAATNEIVRSVEQVLDSALILNDDDLKLLPALQDFSVAAKPSQSMNSAARNHSILRPLSV